MDVPLKVSRYLHHYRSAFMRRHLLGHRMRPIAKICFQSGSIHIDGFINVALLVTKPSQQSFIYPNAGQHCEVITPDIYFANRANLSFAISTDCYLVS